jgi:hypothetical protein
MKEFALAYDERGWYTKAVEVNWASTTPPGWGNGSWEWEVIVIGSKEFLRGYALGKGWLDAFDLLNDIEE